MNKNLLLPLFLILLGITIAPQANAQTCSVDSQYTSPGIYPSDTLPDMQIGTAIADVVQFVFPSDTTLFGFTLTFDSFVVDQLILDPSWLSWSCDQQANNCVYYTTPPNVTRGCVIVTGIPNMQNPLYPAYDSVVVIGEGWVTVPFVGAQAATDSIAVYYRVGPSVSVENPLLANLDLQVNPNPVNHLAKISYNLVEISDVRVSIHDLQGREVAVLKEEQNEVGRYSVNFTASEYPTGVYFVRVELGDGEFVKTKKIITVR